MEDMLHTESTEVNQEVNQIDELDNIDQEALALEKSVELQEQISEILKQLSLERLQTVADFAAFLLDKESEEATQEALAIPGFLEEVQKIQKTSPKKLVNWRTVRSDV
jgi:hypothetical protein